MPEPTDRWFLSDCEGQLVIIREAKLRGVIRDEAGEITGYSLPAEWGPDVVIAEWDLDTWDAGDDESDDQRRKTAAQIVADHNEVEQLRAELTEARAKGQTYIARIKDLAREARVLSGTVEVLTRQRNANRAERDAAREQVKRVREVHTRFVCVCGADHGIGCAGCGEGEYPCSTLRALDAAAIARGGARRPR